MKIRLQQKGQIATKRDYVLLKQNRKSDCNKKYNCQSQDRREVIIARTQGYNQYGPFRFRLATERKIVTKGQNAIKIRVQQKRQIAIPPWVRIATTGYLASCRNPAKGSLFRVGIATNDLIRIRMATGLFLQRIAPSFSSPPSEDCNKKYSFLQSQGCNKSIFSDIQESSNGFVSQIRGCSNSVINVTFSLFWRQFMFGHVRVAENGKLQRDSAQRQLQGEMPSLPKRYNFLL